MPFPNDRNGLVGRRPIRVPDPLPNPAESSLLDPDDDDGGGGGSGLRRRFATPPTPMLVLRPGATPSPSSPDTEDNVAHQTTALFGTFVVEMEGRRMAAGASSCLIAAGDDPSSIGGVQSDGMGDPVIDGVDDGGTMAAMFANNDILPMTAASGTRAAVPDELLTVEMRVGRQLAIIADDVNARYSNDFNKMVRQLRVDQNTAYDAFAGVARQLFGDGVVNWGRIIVLLCFGYRVVVTAVRGCRHLFSKFFSYVIQFIVQEKIASWVASQGGWVAALRYIPESIGIRTIGVIFGVAAVCVAAAIYLTKNH